MLIVVCLYLHRALLDWMANQDTMYVFAVYLLFLSAYKHTHICNNISIYSTIL